MKTKFAIRSLESGRYLSNLQASEHSERFHAALPVTGSCYLYHSPAIARDIAQTEGGIVEIIDPSDHDIAVKVAYRYWRGDAGQWCRIYSTVDNARSFGGILNYVRILRGR